MKAWQVYVTKLAARVWMLDPERTATVLRRIEDLTSAGSLTDSSLSALLRGMGVAEHMSDLTAPSVRASVTL